MPPPEPQYDPLEEERLVLEGDLGAWRWYVLRRPCPDIIEAVIHCTIAVNRILDIQRHKQAATAEKGGTA
jgi:hypothetical protein